MATAKNQAAWRTRQKTGVDCSECSGCGRKLRVDSRGVQCKTCWLRTPEGRAYNQQAVYDAGERKKFDLAVEARAIAAKFPTELGYVNPATLRESLDELEVIPNIGFAHYHCRLDKQCTIYSLAVTKENQRQGWGRLLFYRVLCAAIENKCDRLVVKCPEDLPSNEFYSRLGFHQKGIDPGKKRRLNIWEYKIELPLLFYCGGGGASKFDEIAIEERWRLGLRSAGRNNASRHMEMIDNDWKDYDHKQHLAAVKANKPLIATARDIEKIEDLPKILKEARELAQYAGRVILIPKVETWIPNGYWLGYSVPTSFGGTTINPSWFGDRFVHLLGGSPDAQARYYQAMQNVISLDGNYAMQLADYGKAAYQGASSGIPTGKGCYDSLRISLHEQREYWVKLNSEPPTVHQLSLFD